MPASGDQVYIAAPFPRGPELLPVRGKLISMGYPVTSQWLTAEESYVTSDVSAYEDEIAIAHAKRDIEDLRDADIVVSFTYPGEGRGGRHIEFGMAYAWEKKLYIVGPRENIFHTLPEVTWYPDFDTLVKDWTK